MVLQTVRTVCKTVLQDSSQRKDQWTQAFGGRAGQRPGLCGDAQDIQPWPAARPARVPALERVVSLPWLSVVMPTYNGAAYLTAALESILAQGDDQIEIIAVDDGSTDATVALLESSTDRLPLRIVQRGRVGNWVANTNYGLSLARGEYVCFLHQDDIWLHNRLAILKDRLARGTAATLLLHPAWFIDSTGKRLGLWRCPLPSSQHFLNPSLVVERLLVQNFISVAAPVVRREAALRVGGLDEDLWYMGDWDFWLKLIAAGKTSYCSRALSGFRIHPLSQTVQRSAQSAEFRRQHEVVLYKHLEVWEKRHPDQAAVRRAARFSVEVNMVLAAYVHGQRPDWASLWRSLRTLGVPEWHRFLRDSRIVERVLARLRMGMQRRPQSVH
jgi:glycosyltransferase involved in cell wall biosynthesis